MYQLVGSFFNRHAVAVGHDLRIRWFVHEVDILRARNDSEARVQPLRLLVDMWFQFYFTPLTGVLFTFPSRYLFTIDLKKYVALPVSAGEFTRAIHVSSYSRTTAIKMLRFRVRDYYPLGSHFPVRSST